MSLLDTASLLLTPNAYKEGKLYSVIPSDGSGDFTFTRATTATRVNSAGLVELVPYNLVQYSEQFDNASWSKSNSSVTANSTTSPSGITDADTLTADGTSNRHEVTQIISFTSGLTYTFSVYIKKNTNNFVQILFSGAIFSVNSWANFDLNSGVLGSVGSAATASIESVGNGWYRCTLTATATGTALDRVYLVMTTSPTAARRESNTLSTSIFLWGAQLVEGTNALPYQKTETRLNIPRIDYSLGGCPNILLEPQRTNIATYSEDITQWAGSLSVTANNTISPDGTQNADKVTSSGSTQTRYKSFSGNANCTASIFAKKVDSDYILISYGQPATRYAIFRFSDGVCTTATSGITTTSTNYGNGWWRFSMSTTSLSAGYIELCPNANGTSRDSAGSCYVWGAQYENLASYATSYIPTTTASVTRNKDTTVEKDLTSFGIGNSYTLLFDLTMATEDSNKILFYLKNSAGADSFTFRNFSGILSVYDAIGLTYPLAALANESTKWAFRFDGVNYSLFRVSGGVAVKNTATLGTARNIGYLNSFNISGTKASLKLLAIEPSALTDVECEQFVIS
jgi:hypothetical protein